MSCCEDKRQTGAVRAFAFAVEKHFDGVAAANVLAAFVEVQERLPDHLVTVTSADGHVRLEVDSRGLAVIVHRHVPQIDIGGLARIIGLVVPSMIGCLPSLTGGPLGYAVCLGSSLIPKLFQERPQGIEEKLVPCLIEGLVHAVRCVLGELGGGEGIGGGAGRKNAPVRRCD